MGEVLVEGPGAEAFLNQTLTNDIRKLAAGHGQYTLMCNETGGVVDDLYAYHLENRQYLLIINASRIEEDVGWLEKQLTQASQIEPVILRNASEKFGAVAVQGPRVVDFIDRCFAGRSQGGVDVNRVSDLKKNQVAKMNFEGSALWISRTGYTGEDGFELISPAVNLENIWNKLLTLGKESGLVPAGLGARDTLRTEVCYPLYGHELDERTTPIEAGLGVFVSLDKGEFVGRETLAQQKQGGVKKRLIAFKMNGKSAPPRPHYPVWQNGTRRGEVTSGTQSPSLGIGIGMAYLSPEAAAPGTSVEIEIRGNRNAAIVVPKPIYRKPH
jgi:aminomethyltransferase